MLRAQPVAGGRDLEGVFPQQGEMPECLKKRLLRDVLGVVRFQVAE
jgi:hypothetical protein